MKRETLIDNLPLSLFMERGRPLKWTSPQEFEAACDEYFKLREEQGKPPLWTGLAIHLGFESRQSLWEYGKREEFSLPIKRALVRVEASYEENLHNGKPIGSIFALKNFDWKDKQEVTQEITVKEPVVTQVEIIHTNENQRGQEP